MFPGAKIIAIDDEEDELAKIVASLRELGLACISYNYPDEMPPEPNDVSGIRVLFLDINLIGGASPDQDANVFNAPISLIERLVTDSNGPYALITWSSTELHGRLMERIEQTESLKNRQPFYARPLSKEDYSGDAAKLKDEVEKIFSENSSFGALLDWERRVSRAGETVLAEIHRISEEFDGESASEKMDRMLSKLAVDAFGRSHVEHHRFEAVNEALLPILSDALQTHFFAEPDGGIWEQAITKYGEAAGLQQTTVSKLNTSVVLETAGDIKPYRRGAILKLPDDWSKDEEFERLFGAKPSRVRGEILKLDEPKSPIWVLLQAQAACDFAQGRLGPIPYLLAAIVPADHERKKNSDGVELPLPATIWRSPRLASAGGFCDTDFSLEVIHGIACQLTRKMLEENGFEVIGRLKDQVVGSIAYEYHSHGSRPGFVSFR